MARDDRPFYALGAALLLLGVALAVPQGRAWLAQNVAASLQGQAEPASGAKVGYSAGSLAFWAVLGAAFAWAAYELLFARLGFRPDRAFFVALAPFLLFGPMLHALLAAGALPSGPLAYAAAEPVIYLTTAALALAALLVGRAAKRAWVVPAIGVALLVPLLVMLGARATPAGAGRVALLLGMALVPALALGYAYARWKPVPGFAASALVVGAHALDGATTWMVLRDPFHLGFPTFGEKNPLSALLVDLSNGWPYFALKLALPLVLLSLVKAEEKEGEAMPFLLLAVFALGFGPGMANLLQVLLQ